MKHFVGLTNYFERLISNFLSTIKPLNYLHKTNVSFNWTAKCETAFDMLKHEISSFPVVQPYSLEKEVTLTTDASLNAWAACVT